MNGAGKKIIIMTAAAALLLSSCAGNGGDETAATTTERPEWTGDLIQVEVDKDALDMTVDISGKVLKYMGHFDLNPTNDAAERSMELAIFEDVYGASIEWMPTDWGARFDNLAVSILGGNPPDIFRYEWLSFPNGISKGQYQPVDSLIDWNDPMWASVKELSSQYVWNGEHYIVPHSFSLSDTIVLIYNKSLVESEGFDDPLQLHRQGRWDWDTFADMMKSFVENDPENNFGIAGRWSNPLVFTTGETMVKYSDGRFVNNMSSAGIERAMNVVVDVTRNGLIKSGWHAPQHAFVPGDLLFYGMGTWAFNDCALSLPNDLIEFVPFPQDPRSDRNYVDNAISAWMWVNGSTNGDVVKAWLNCSRLVNFDEKYVDTAKEKFLANNPGWTPEQYDRLLDFYDPAKFTFVYDFGFGFSEVGEAVMDMLYEGIPNGTYESWAQLRDTYSDMIDTECAVYN